MILRCRKQLFLWAMIADDLWYMIFRCRNWRTVVPSGEEGAPTLTPGWKGNFEKCNFFSMITQNSIIGNHQHNIVLTLICSPFLYLVNLNCYGWSATWFNIALTTFSLPEYEARWRAVRSEWEEPWDWNWTPKDLRSDSANNFFVAQLKPTRFSAKFSNEGILRARWLQY